MQAQTSFSTPAPSLFQLLAGMPMFGGLMLLVVYFSPWLSSGTGLKLHMNTSGTSPGSRPQQIREIFVGFSFLFFLVWGWGGGSVFHLFSSWTNTAPVLYLTMRFAKTIKQIQGIQAYHAGDKLNVEVDIVLDASTPLQDSHDLR